MSFWEWTWTFILWTFEVFVVVAAIFLIILIFSDLFRDHTLAAGWKVLWVIFLVFFPILGSLVYIIARGRGMAERYEARQVQPAPEDDAYRPLASTSPADDIAQAKAMLDSGAITQGEYEALKSKALGNQYFG